MENDKDKIMVKSFKQEKSDLDSEARILVKAQKSNKKWTAIWSVVVLITVVERIYYYQDASIWQTVISISGLIIALLGLIVQSSNFDKNQKSEFELRRRKSIVDDAAFLEDIKELNQEERAMRQLTKKQSDLEQYNTLKLSHTKSIFIIGVIIIFIGIFTIIGTLGITIFNQDYVKQSLVISGFAGGILIDFVGAIFIAMYSKTVEAANHYQSSLVETANTYLSNVLAAQISDQQLREQTLFDMAKKLVQIENIKFEHK